VIRFGIAGWDYKDWWGPVYPAVRPRGFDPLAYVARFFDTVEINSTFYNPGTPAAAAKWGRRVRHNPAFMFTAKLWRRFTHEREQPWNPAELEGTKATFRALADEGRLGCVLAQFPWSFKRVPESLEWLEDVIGGFREFPLAVEVRHASWNDGAFYDFLAERGVGAVNVDQPLFAKSIRPEARVTAPLGYVRLHGRNYENWFRENAESHERYDYLYSADELRGWLDRIHEVAKRARDTYVITNNHYRGQAPANAAMLRKLYGHEQVEVPPALAAAFASVLTPLGITAGEDGPPPSPRRAPTLL
jgi:uncharacterized protein YecE (DUF72 family)